MTRRGFLRNTGILLAVAVPLLCGSPIDAANAPPVAVLVTYHSATGNPEKMARGVADEATTGPGDLGRRVAEVAAIVKRGSGR